MREGNTRKLHTCSVNAVQNSTITDAPATAPEECYAYSSISGIRDVVCSVVCSVADLHGVELWLFVTCGDG